MPKVTFFIPGQSNGQVVDAKIGETLLEVALRANIPLNHECGGCCSCATCHVHIQEGEKNLSLQDAGERFTLKSATEVTAKSRLCCQSRIEGDVVVKIP